MADTSYSMRKHDHNEYFQNKLTGHYVATSQLEWLICKGDLLVPNIPKESTTELQFSFRLKDKKLQEIPIYSYDHDDRPETYQGSSEGSSLAFLITDSGC
jgi:hypothetical protein